MPPAHPLESDDRLVKGGYLLLQRFVQGIPLLPVPALDRAHVLRSGIVKIQRKVLLQGLLLDLREDLGFQLRAVRLMGGVVFFPKGG